MKFEATLFVQEKNAKEAIVWVWHQKWPTLIFIKFFLIDNSSKLTLLTIFFLLLLPVSTAKYSWLYFEVF